MLQNFSIQFLYCFNFLNVENGFRNYHIVVNYYVLAIYE